MKKSFLALLIASSLVMAGCEDKETQQKLQNAEQTIIQLKAELEMALKNQALQVEIVKILDKKEVIKHKVDPKEEFGIEETEVSSVISIPKTNMPWLNQLLISKVYENNEEKETSFQNESELIQSIEKQYQAIIETIKQEPMIGYEDSVYSSFVGQRNNVATFRMFYFSYTGGAHGINHTAYINVDLNKKSAITLNNLVSPQNQPKLKEMLWENYRSERLDENGQYNGYIEQKDIFISDDFYFSANGITFVYPPYVLGPYVEGDVEIEMSWYQINALLSPDYQQSEKDGFYFSEYE